MGFRIRPEGKSWGGTEGPAPTPTVKRPTVSVAVPKSHRRLTGTTIPHTPGDSAQGPRERSQSGIEKSQ